MSSSITWLDLDGEAHKRAMNLLATFKERESRDELGVGGIRDAIADRLFPGTSTIQTRLRYMCFIPWIYDKLEKRQRPAKRFAVEAREAEIALMDELRKTEKSGLIGRDAGATLKRLPSSIYWSGLGAWGLRRFPGSQQEYCGGIEGIYKRRDSRRKNDAAEWAEEDRCDTWQPQLLALQPKDFPAGATFALTKDEAEVLLDGILRTQSGSLLAGLADRAAAGAGETKCYAPWQHPDFESFPQEQREFLHNARIFSFLHHGAALLYNLLLAELHTQGLSAEQLAQSPPEMLAETYRASLATWVADPEFGDLAAWSPAEFKPEVEGRGYVIRRQTWDFIENWRETAVAEQGDVANSSEARALICSREEHLKGGQSRLTNPRALAQWGGNAGTGRLTYRWGTAQDFLNDLRKAFKG